MAKDSNRKFQEVIDRIKAARGLKTNKEVAEALGLTASNLGERKTRGALPRDEIDELCKAARLSPAWVYEGIGEMLSQPEGQRYKAALATLKRATEVTAALPLPATDRASLAALFDAVLNGDLPRLQPYLRRLNSIYVPLLDVEVSAGAGAISQEARDQVVDVLAFDPRWLEAIGVSATRLRVIRVRGDSMADTLHDGDLILVDVSPVTQKTPGVYVMAKEDALLVKRLNFKLNGTVEVQSDNPAYATETIGTGELDRLHIIGRMVRRVVR